MSNFFVYDNTTVDEIIDHLLYELNNDFIESGICISQYCFSNKNPTPNDQRREIQVKTKLITHGLVTANQSTQGYRNYVSIAEPGTHFHQKGDWLKQVELEQINEANNNSKINGTEQQLSIAICRKNNIPINRIINYAIRDYSEKLKKES